MATERFVLKAGEVAAQHVDDPTMLVIPAWPPTDVRLPESLGGHIVDVISSDMAMCPFCKVEHRNLNMDGISVMDCSEKGFLWYRRTRGKNEGTDSV